MSGTAPSHFRYDVFLSYSTADTPVVRELAERLRQAGLRVWLEEWMIGPGESGSAPGETGSAPGDSIATAVKEGLEQSAVLVFCMSADAFGADWNRLLSLIALFSAFLNHDRRFVPLRLDDAPIQPRLGGSAWIDWRPNANRAEEWPRLLAACRPAEAPVPGGAAADPLRALDLFHPGGVVGVAWSLDGQRLASVARNGKLVLWDAASGGGLAENQNENGLGNEWSAYRSKLAFCVGWSADRQRLATSDDDEVQIREVASGRVLAVLRSNSLREVSCLGWSPDGQQLASASNDATVRVWDVASGRALAALQGHKGRLRNVGWGPDRQGAAGAAVLWSADEYGAVLLWQTESWLSQPAARSLGSPPTAGASLGDG